MLTFSLDTNCIIAVDEERPEAVAIRRLVAAHCTGDASVGLVAISASERQKDGAELESFASFKARLAHLGLDRLDLLEPMMYWDVTFWDFSLWDGDDEGLERRIHDILFPQVEFEWADYSAARGLSADAEAPDRRWLNAKCDVQAFWSHAFRKRDVFVTSDMNFHAASKKPKLLMLAGGRIELPRAAAALVAGEQDAV